jgi:cysteine desulfurase/selenocysteine lyase
MNFKEEFPLLKTNIIYFDNCATTLKPKCVVDSISDYYLNYPSNAHRGDYDISKKVDDKINVVRKKLAHLLNAKNESEIIFTSGCTDSLNKIIKGYFQEILKENDEILTTKAEHASLLLPWFDVAKKTGAKIVYAPLTDGCVTLEGIKSVTTDKTKIISVAIVSNVMGYVAPVKEIIKFAHEHDIIVVCDGAQSVPHHITDVIADDIDFLAFSGHKMCGPTGVGVLVGKKALLEKMEPLCYGGGMNNYFEEDNSYELKDIPTRFEAGTPPIAEVIGLGEAIKYLMNIGMDKIREHEKKLKEYLIDRIKDIDNLIIYNNSDTGIFSFNIDRVFAQDVSIYLNHYNIYVRAGNHCAKLLKD